MDLVLLDWPYAGLVLATGLLAWLAFAPRAPGALPRWQDPVWVMRLIWPMYLIHQFEEHGIDALGRHFAFLSELCAALGFPGGVGCPADAGFIFAVNPVECWIAFALPYAFGRQRPLLAACAWGIPLVNAVVHIGSALAHLSYNPGVATSVLLFLPLGGWMLHTALAAGVIVRRQLPRIFATGVAVHVVLMASLLLREHGLPYAVLIAVNAAGGFLPFAFAPRRAELA